MASNLILGILEVLALASCLWGFHTTWGNSGTKLDLAYNAAWFVLGSVANIIGIVSAYYGWTHEEPGPKDDVAKGLRHNQYVLSWLTVIFGYPTLITSFYMNYYEGFWVHLIGLSSLIPFATWFIFQERLIAISTQATIVLLIPVHVWISYSTENWLGLYGAGAMGVNLISLSIPTRYEFWGLTPPEMFATTVGLGSIFFAQALDTMTKDKNCYCYKAR